MDPAGQQKGIPAVREAPGNRSLPLISPADALGTGQQKPPTLTFPASTERSPVQRGANVTNVAKARKVLDSGTISPGLVKRAAPRMPGMGRAVAIGRRGSVRIDQSMT